MAYKRLKHIVSLVDEEDRVLDIGTDHGLVPIFLHQIKNNVHVHASDINKKPLEIAKKNLLKHNLFSDVMLFLTDGTLGIDLYCYDTLVIAGMGGNEISKILLKSLKLKHKLILHPTNNHQKVRKTLKRLGYKIIIEDLVVEHKINNVIIKAIKRWDLTPNTFLGNHLWRSASKQITAYYNEQCDYYKKLYNKSNNRDYKTKQKLIERKLKWREKNL